MIELSAMLTLIQICNVVCIASLTREGVTLGRVGTLLVELRANFPFLLGSYT